MLIEREWKLLTQIIHLPWAAWTILKENLKHLRDCLKALGRENYSGQQLTILFVNLDQRFKALLGACQTILTLILKEEEWNWFSHVTWWTQSTFVAPNCMRAFPFTSVAEICIIRASTVYAELQPCFVNSSMQIAPPSST